MACRVLICTLLTVAAMSQVAAQEAVAPPPKWSAATEGERVWSMGQPPLLKWEASVSSDSRKDGGLAAFGVQKDLLNPLAGVFAVRAEGVLGAGRAGVEGGARVLALSPLSRLQFGLDYDVRSGAVDFLLGAEMTVRRGGLFGHGTRLRLGWLPERDHTFQLGVSVPLGQRAGSTRPRSDRLKLQSAAAPAGSRDTAATAAPLAEFRAAADAVSRLVSPLTMRLGGDAEKAVAPDVAAVNALDRPAQILARMQDAWRGLFTGALADSTDAGSAAAIAAAARRVMLEHAILPFDGMFGQRRSTGSLYTFARGATERFAAAPVVQALSPDGRRAALIAFAGAFRALDGVRADIRRIWRTDRRVFLPLQLALAPDESDTQGEIDALLERAIGESFSDGNRVYYVLNEAFQFEFSRTVAMAQRYHVLWIHDVRAEGETGAVDKVSALHVEEYLNALADRVRRYDEVGSLPQYHIILDQYFYQNNNGRRWMTLLEHPLTHRIELAGADAEVARLRKAQQSLRDAVAGAQRLQAGRARFGDDWLLNLVKVHVNITHPADLSYWSSGLIPLVGMPDNLMRDHRKIVYYDLSEEDPSMGELMFSGMGLGEHYAGANWEDRAMIVRGPAALKIKEEARRLFARQGFNADQLPAAFRDLPLPADYETRAKQPLAAASSAMPLARVMQSHNDVGYGQKKASVSKAILLSLMPSGSVMIAPDSLWEDALWGSLMMGSALRGCRVLVIAPATENAPGTSWPVMARMHMLTSRLAAMARALQPRFDAEGGLFKVGLFNEQSGVGDLAARADEARQKWEAAGGWMQALIPFGDETKQLWSDYTKELARTHPVQYLVTPTTVSRPKLHMKGLYVATRTAWDGLFARPEMAATLVEYLRQRARQVSGQQRDVRELPEMVWKARRVLLAAHEATLTPGERDHVVQYLQIGSFNMNDRSMLLDGEVELTVSGLAAHSGMLDFVMVSGLTTWVESQAQIDALIRPPTAFKRLLARWARSIL